MPKKTKEKSQDFGEIVRCDQTWVIAGPERAIFRLQRLQKAACSASHLLRRMEPSRVCCSRDHWENCGERTLQGLDQNQTDRGPGNVKLPQMWQDRQGGLGFPSGKYFDVDISFFWFSNSKPIQSLTNQFRMFWILPPIYLRLFPSIFRRKLWPKPLTLRIQFAGRLDWPSDEPFGRSGGL